MRSSPHTKENLVAMLSWSMYFKIDTLMASNVLVVFKFGCAYICITSFPPKAATEVALAQVVPLADDEVLESAAPLGLEDNRRTLTQQIAGLFLA